VVCSVVDWPSNTGEAERGKGHVGRTTGGLAQQHVGNSL